MRCMMLTPAVFDVSVPCSVPPGVDAPASLACRFGVFPNAFNRPIKPLALGVVGVCRPTSLVHTEGSSVVVLPGVVMDVRRVLKEK